jgi:hypothetical protein
MQKRRVHGGMYAETAKLSDSCTFCKYVVVECREQKCKSAVRGGMHADFSKMK